MSFNGSSPADLQALLQLVKYAQRFPDFPQNFNWSLVFDNNREKPVQNNHIYATAISTIILASLVVIGRFVVRVRRREWGWDDNFMVATWIFALGWGTLQILFVTIGGIGHHIYDVTYRTLQLDLQIAHWALVLYTVMAQFLRTSIFLYLRRIVPEKSRMVHRLIAWTVIFQTTITVIALLFDFLSCRNPATIWSLDVRLRDDRCLPWLPVFLVISTVLTASDIWTFCVPLRLVWSLNLPKRSQIAAVFVFIVGSFAIASSIARLFYIVPSYTSWDATWNGNGTILWVQFEGTFGIIAACLPVFNVLLVDDVPRWMKLSPTLRSFLSSSKDSLNEERRDYQPPVPTLVPNYFSPRSNAAVEAGLVRPQDLESMKGSDFITGHDFFSDSEGGGTSEEFSANEEKLYARYYSQTRRTRSSHAVVDRSAATRSWPVTRGIARTQSPHVVETSADTMSIRSFDSGGSRDTNASVWVLHKP